jgi:hypothetical protein
MAQSYLPLSPASSSVVALSRKLSDGCAKDRRPSHKLQTFFLQCSGARTSERFDCRRDDDDEGLVSCRLPPHVAQGACKGLRCGKQQQQVAGGGFGSYESKQQRQKKRGLERSLVLARVSEATDSSNGEGTTVVQQTASRDEDSKPRAKLSARRVETHDIEEMQRPLAEYMSLPASQYSVLDAERIERVDDTMFKCYVHRLKFFSFEVGPVLLVAVEEQPDGCCIRLLSCTLEGSPIVVAQNKKFSASMSNKVSWTVSDLSSPSSRRLVSDTTIEVSIEIPFAFRALPVKAIEGTGNKVLSQLLKVVLPRFLTQLGKDYYAWASGDESRKPVGTGEL